MENIFNNNANNFLGNLILCIILKNQELILNISNNILKKLDYFILLPKIYRKCIQNSFE